MDPQLDANTLIKIHEGVPVFVEFAGGNRRLGLTYNLATREEFLAKGAVNQNQLETLEQQFGIQLLVDVSRAEIETTALRLRSAFLGNEPHRVLDEADSKVAATAFIKGERLATGDLRLFKRAKDLGIDVLFIGTGRAAARAAAYVPRPVDIR